MNYKPLVPNNPLKFVNLRSHKPLIRNQVINRTFSENSKFKLWLDSNLLEKKSFINRNTINYKGEKIYDNDLEVVTKKKYIVNFINKLNNLLEENNYKINNNKEYRDTIATFIYKNSK